VLIVTAHQKLVLINSARVVQLLLVAVTVMEVPALLTMNVSHKHALLECACFVQLRLERCVMDLLVL
jgi:hypothetical protein